MSSTQPLHETFPYGSLPVQQLGGPDLNWTQLDTDFSEVFQARDIINILVHLYYWWPVNPEIAVGATKQLLRQLEDFITSFDEYIGHSDTGFSRWCWRYQLAIDAGIVPAPVPWPTREPEGVAPGHTRKYRYSSIALVRELLFRKFLAESGIVQTDAPFGIHMDRARQTLLCPYGGVLAMPPFWYSRIDSILENFVMSPNDDAEAAQNHFWGSLYRSPEEERVRVNQLSFKANRVVFRGEGLYRVLDAQERAASEG